MSIVKDSKRQKPNEKTGKTKVVQKKKPGATNTKQMNQKFDKRAAVAAKYKNPNTNEKWSGRGRTPSWVVKFVKRSPSMFHSSSQTITV